MLAYHMLSPTFSIKEAGLMTYLQTLPDASHQCPKLLLACKTGNVHEDDWFRLVEQSHQRQRREGKEEEKGK